jgi:hypothetical protein
VDRLLGYFTPLVLHACTALKGSGPSVTTARSSAVLTLAKFMSCSSSYCDRHMQVSKLCSRLKLLLSLSSA